MRYATFTLTVHHERESPSADTMKLIVTRVRVKSRSERQALTKHVPAQTRTYTRTSGLHSLSLRLQYDEIVKRMLPGFSTMNGTRSLITFL